MLTMTTAATTVSPHRTRRRAPSSVSNPATLRRLGLPLGFPLPPLTVRGPSGLASPPMSPASPNPLQTKSVEYYRAAPAAPGSYSIDLERVHLPTVRPTRSPSDPPMVAPLMVSKRVKAPPAAIMVPPNLNQPEIVRPPRSPARAAGYFDTDLSPSANSNAPTSPRSKTPNRGPAPGPPPMGPLPPLPDQGAAFSEADPLMLRAVSARDRRENRRPSKTPDDRDIASLERSMRRLSRISLVTGSTSPAAEAGSGPTSPTLSLAGSLNGGVAPSIGRAERAEKLLRRISRQSETIRLPQDYGRVGISGFTAPSSAPVSPGLPGVSSPLRPHRSEGEASELAYLADERPAPAVSVPMRRNVDHAQSGPGKYIPTAEPYSLGLGLTLTPSDSMSSAMASTSMSTLSSLSSMSTLPSDPTITTLPSESTIRPQNPETRPGRLGSLSSASSAAASIHSAHTYESASSASLLTPISPPASTTPLPKPPRSPMSPPRQLRMKASIRLPSPSAPRSGSPDITSILSQYRDSPSLAVPDAPLAVVAATRVRPGARPRVHSDLNGDVPPPVPPKDSLKGGEEETRDGMKSSRSSTDSRVAVDSHGKERISVESGVLEVPPMRPSLESQTTPRVVNRFAAPAPTPKATTSRPSSPDISYILRSTPRPTRKSSQSSLASSAVTSRRTNGIDKAPPSSFRPMPNMAGPSRRGSEMSMDSSRRSSSAVTASSSGLDLEGTDVFYGEQYDSEDSDSDLDLCTPLPHMMLRAGLLSPRSTIITESMELPESPREPSQSGRSARGEALRLRGEKVWKAESKRKIRHRDGRNLRDGVGLTTGLGWSDSEDEDAPSPLRRRLSSVLLAKAQSRPSSALSREPMAMLHSPRSTFSNIDSTSVSSQSMPRTPSSHPLSLPLTPSSLPGAVAGADEFGKLDFPMPPTATNWRTQPSPGMRRIPSNTMLRSASSSGIAQVPTSPNPPASRARTISTASSAATHSTSSHASVRSRQSKMPTPTPRPSRINVRAPTTTRLSAPEALRQAGSILADGPRRLSGV